MKQFLQKTFGLRAWMIVAMLTAVVSGAWADDTYTIGWGTASGSASTNFSAVSGTVDGILSFSTDKNSSSTTPAYNANSSELRLYYHSSGDGGSITLTPASGITITGFVMTTSTSPSVGYSVDGGAAANISASSNTYTVSDISASSSLKIQNVNTSNTQLRIKTIEITYTTGGGNTSTLDDNDLTLAPVELEFDLYNNSNAQVINYTTSSTGEVTVSTSNYATFVVDETNKTITVTPTAVTPSPQTITVSQAADDDYNAGTATFTISIDDSTPIPTHTATFSINGVISSEDFEEGEDIDFPSDPAEINGKSFVGWTTAAIAGTTNDAPTLVTSATMGSSNVTYYAVFAYVSGSATNVTDELTRETTGITGTNYSNWKDKTGTSGAVYAGNSAGGNDAIQLRSNNSNSGIVTTASGGIVTKVVVDWGSSTTSGRTLNIYGSNKAYSTPEALYNYSTPIGTIVCGTSTELTISDDYAYIGIRSASGALYLDKVSITWSTGSSSISDYCTTVVAATVERPVITVAENPFVFSTTATISCATDGASIYYRYSEADEWTAYSSALSINATTTIYAKAVKGNDESSVASVTATKNLAEPTVTIDDTGITNTDVYSGTVAGELAASVTYNDAAVEGAVVTWSGNNDEVATIDASTGAVTLVAAGSVTFTATYAGNSDYAEKTATYQMTVTNSDPNVPGTENNPYTVAQARAAIDAGAGVTGVYATGIVSEIVTEYSETYHNISYNISADGLTTSDQLQAFRGKSYNGENFTSADDIQVGDVVVVYGNLTKYNSTYEFAAGNQLVSLDRPVNTNPTITVSPATIEAIAAGAYGTITVTYNNITNVVAEVNFCDANGDDATYNWITASINSENNVEYLIDANNGVARTAYFRVYALDDEAHDVYSEIVTVTQEAAPETYALSWTADANATLYVFDNDETNGLLTSSPAEVLSGHTVYVSIEITGDYVLDQITVTTTEGAVAITEEEPGVYYSFTMPALATTITVTTKAKPASTSAWVKTDLADLTSGDVFIIVATNADDENYAMSNDNGTSGAPSAVAVTVANDKITDGVADNIKWNISGNATDGYTFYPNGDDESWLYCTNTNNGVRVGTGDAKHFTLSGDNYLTTTETSDPRYLGVYNKQDWRCYKSTSTNINDQTFAFYRYAADYERNVKDGNYGTICLPYDGTVIGAELYSIAGKNSEVSSISLNDVTSLEAGKPYIFKATADKILVTYTGAEAATEAQTVNGLVGSFTGTSVAEGMYILSGGVIKKCGTGCTIGANKAYIDMSLVPTTQQPGVKSIAIADLTDGINVIQTVNGQQLMYNISGQRVMKAQKGIYIVGGKKVVVK